MSFPLPYSPTTIDHIIICPQPKYPRDGKIRTKIARMLAMSLPPTVHVTQGDPTISFQSKDNSSDRSESPGAMSNGTPLAKSPSPQVPNGKPTSPYVKESNPMGSGAAQTVSSKDPKAAAQAASDMRNVVRRKLTGYVGFANLPNQWHRKSVRKGFNFNVMVVGEYINRTVSLC